MTTHPTPSVTLAGIPDVYAQPDPSTLSKLPKPTRSSNDKGHCNECGGYHGLPAVHIDYMGHADITLALIAIDPDWNWEPLAFDSTGLPMITREGNLLVMWGKLTVLGKTVIGVGTCETGKGEPQKELIGDFLRNGAMRFGLATKLWSKADRADPAGSDAGGGYEPRPRASTRRSTEGAAPLAPTEHTAAQQVAVAFAALDPERKKAVSAWAREELEINNVMKAGDKAGDLLAFITLGATPTEEEEAF